MVNIQQMEMRRNELNPLVQDNKGPRPGDPHDVKGGRGRPVPAGEVSPYGPARRPVAAARQRRRQGEDRS
ncbi:MAG TPA: hypothetical protein VF174_14660 [Micromonosporaceae bacterium]